MLKRVVVRIPALAALLLVGVGVFGCVDNRPRNGAGEPVDSQTGVVAPGGITSQ